MIFYHNGTIWCISIKESHIGNESSLVIENVDDMFFVILVDIKTEKVLAEYMLEGAIV